MPRVVVPLAEGCEELEAVTLLDLFVRAKLDVVSVSLSSQRLVRCSRGVVIQTDYTLDDVNGQNFDLVVVCPVQII